MSIFDGTLIRLHVPQLPGRRDREPNVLWLWWYGDDESSLDLDRVRRAYTRRFDLEHTFRFAKQALGWTTPKLRTPEQADLWLSSQAALPADALTPGRVRRESAHLLPLIGTPASWPKHTRPDPDARKAPDPRPPCRRHENAGQDLERRNRRYCKREA